MKKTNQVTVRLNDDQYAQLQKLIDAGTVKTFAAAIQYIINQKMILK